MSWVTARTFNGNQTKSEVGKMKHLGTLALLVMTISLSGCQSASPEQETTTPVAKPAAIVTFTQANRCLDDLNGSDVGKRVFSQILFSPAIAREHSYLENSTQYLTDAQVELLKEFREKNKECRALRLQAFREYELKVQLTIFHNEIDQMFDELQNKRITIGQGNKQSNVIRARYQAEVRKFFDRSKEIDEERFG
jgi:hypothetical protein